MMARAVDTPAEQATAYAAAQRERFVDELAELVRFPTVSTHPRHAPALAACARWLATHLGRLGLEHVQVMETSRHPLVYADWLRRPGKPTVLIYGHYDVQPVDPLAAWITPPFEPVIRDGALFGRGASDDKGQFFAHLKALEAYLYTCGRLPINVKILLEGEEEIGSGSLQELASRRPALLAAGAAVISDMRIPAPNQPAITVSLRGVLSLDLQVQGMPRDLHSGTFGGAVLNPVQALCEILAGLHDRQGRIAIRGFYDNVRQPGATQRAYMARVGPSDTAIRRDAGIAHGWGEPGYSLYERTSIRPSLSINGVTGGYQGPGPKSVIPAQAGAILSLRLVPDQDPWTIEHLVCQHLAKVAPPGLDCRLRVHAAARPVVASSQALAVQAAEVAYTRGFGRPPVYLASGGTIPIANTLQQTLGIAPVLMGFALPDDGMHGPNEKFHLACFDRGIRTSIYFLAAMGAEPRKGGGSDY